MNGIVIEMSKYLNVKQQVNPANFLYFLQFIFIP